MTHEPLAGPSTDSETPDVAERQRRIEELLLEGLDHYFSGRFERAITVWTRVAFLERGHGRARAYIERARRAQAEQHRESEEWLHAGVAAYHGGQLLQARELLTRAVEQGGAHETALVYLDRLNRLEGTTPAEQGHEHPRTPVATADASRTGRQRWGATLAASAGVAVAIVLVSLPVRSYLVQQPMPAAVPAPSRERLPVVGDASRRLALAQEAYRLNRRADALRLLDGIARTDPVRPKADALLAAIQRSLLEDGGPSTAESR